MSKETKEKSLDKKKTKSKSKKKVEEQSSIPNIPESIRQVIRNKKPLTPHQVKQFLSGVITGEIVDCLTKRGAMTTDRINASKLLLEEYRKDEIAEKEKIENEARMNSNSASAELTKELLFEINNRKVEGVVEEQEQQEEVVEENQNDLQQ